MFCLGIKERTEKEKDSRGLDSDCRKASTCDGHHGRIRTRIGPFKYFMEILSSLLSNGSNLTSISIRSWPQLSILYRHVFCPSFPITRYYPLAKTQQKNESSGPVVVRRRPCESLNNPTLLSLEGGSHLKRESHPSPISLVF